MNKLRLYQAVLEDIRDNLGCDSMAHRCNNPCYSCIAEKALKGMTDPWEKSEERDASLRLDEITVGRYYALISGYHDYYGAGFELIPSTTKIKLKAKSAWDVLPRKKTLHVYTKQIPNVDGNSAGTILEIEVLEKGGYKIIRKIR